MKEKYDFSGWATKCGIRCSDGRTIVKGAFKEQDGETVPLVWMHQHDTPDNVLGHALLVDRDGSMYAYCKFNDTEAGKTAKSLVSHGDVRSLSIYANGLKQDKGNVMHGKIREVSLVLAGANPGAMIDFPILSHGEESESEAVIYNDDYIMHYDEEFEYVEESENTEEVKEEVEELEHADETPKEEKKSDKTVADVWKEIEGLLNDEQMNVLHYVIGEAASGAESSEDKEEESNTVKHNVFDTDDNYMADELSHEAMETIIKDGKRYGSLSESVLAHAEDYGIDGIEWLFPEDRNLNNTPDWIKREDGWVSVVMNGVHHTPFSRVKSQFANITEDEARARGYIKGHLKKEEVFSLLRRSTTPQTVYKKQKLDRDDIIDITDFDVVSWLKGEMRMMLNEELARAYLIGDGRLGSDEDKISEDHIRPIANDADLFTIKKAVTVGQNATDDDWAKAIIRAAVKARKDYKGSGNPTFFTTEDVLTDMLLLEDQIGHKIYKTEAELATALRVTKIVTVPVMEGHQVGGKDLIGIIVNLQDYNVGADKGGAISMFEDFDIDYNQEKYLIETRCSGALTKPYSAIILFKNEVPTSVDGDVESSKTVQP